MMAFYYFLDSRFRGNDTHHPASLRSGTVRSNGRRGELLHSAKMLHKNKTGKGLLVRNGANPGAIKKTGLRGRLRPVQRRARCWCDLGWVIGPHKPAFVGDFCSEPLRFGNLSR